MSLCHFRSGNLYLLAVLAVVLSADSSASAAPAVDASGDTSVGVDSIDFNRDIRPIFVQHCLACHGGVKQASDLSFIYRDKVLSEAASGNRPVVPGKPGESYLLDRVSSPDASFRMPPAKHGPALSAEEIDRLRRWIEQGAQWAPHWAYVPPSESPPEEVSGSHWCRAPWDRFVLARLQREGLQPSPEADRAAWLRRVSFDLVGLPPTEQQLADFARDDRPDAFEQAVDRLLESRHFGERWAAVWLDLVRYADTMGYEKDLHRNIWPYRDWLIRAFNADMPYDVFTIKQLAGDLLPGASIDDRLATACHRNTQTNTEGGTDDEEFRVAAVLDRVNTTWQIWQGTTFGCVQCHSHPYDPFEHEEYYRFFAVFNTTRDGDVSEELPLLEVPRDYDDYSQAGRLDEQISSLKQEQHTQVTSLAADESQWTGLTPDRAISTGSTELNVVENQADGVAEVLAQGTITAGSQFTIETPLPRDLRQLTALRLEALPQNSVAALQTPEDGFVLTRLKAYVIPPGEAEPEEIELAAGWCDDPEPVLNPTDSLRDNNRGWASYSKISKRRYAVFVLDRPHTIIPGSRLKLVLGQNRRAVGDIPLVFRRSRYSVSSHGEWNTLLERDDFQSLTGRLASLQKRRRQIDTVPVPVMREQTAKLNRQAFVFSRGNWLDKAQPVEAGTPQLLPPLESEQPTRLDVARWLVSGDNPLTSRVMVNRVWEQLFGVGIVETVGDFGSAGTSPSHPHLLDALALRFQNEHDWSLKRLLREIVLSATYRQDSRVTPEQLQRDPRNRLLARGPRQRLSAEMVRDQALALSGQFDDQMFGEPVMPPQPDGIWRSVYSNARWETDTGGDRYRRAVYTYWKRTSPYPAMMSFDAPTREVCSMQRLATNSPLQALVTLNDPAFVELAQGFAQRMNNGERESPAEQIAWAYRVAAGRRPDSMVQDELEQLYADARQQFRAIGDDAHHLAETSDQFARVIVANTILNLDEVLTK